jgi:hypothetical protein
MVGRIRLHIGWSNSLGWYEGFSLLTAVDCTGVITGLCFGAASTTEQSLAETFFALRANPNPRLKSVGSICSGPYVAYSRVSRAKKTIGGGLRAMVYKSFIHPNETPASEAGPSNSGGGWLPSARLLRASTTNSSTPSASGESDPMSWRVCEVAWRRG